MFARTTYHSIRLQNVPILSIFPVISIAYKTENFVKSFISRTAKLSFFCFLQWNIRFPFYWRFCLVHSKNLSCEITRSFLVWWKITLFFVWKMRLDFLLVMKKYTLFMWMNVWGNEAVFIENADFFLVLISFWTDGWSIHDNFMLHWALFSDWNQW